MKHLFVDNMRGFQRRIDGKHYAPYSKALLFHADGTKYDKDAKSLVCRDRSIYGPTLKQGFVFSSAGAGCLNYGVRNLITGSTTKMRWQFQLNTVAGAGTTRRICSEYNSTGNKRGWQWYISVENVLTIVVGNNGGTGSAYAQAITGCTPESGDYFDITFNAGVFTVVKNGTTTYTQDRSATQIAIYNNNSPNLNVGGYLDSASTSYNGSMCCFKIWVDNILDTDTPKFVAPMGDKTGRDIISGTKPAVVGTVNMSALSDTASFRAEEYGFAVKSGEIFLKNYSGSGYAGLVGTADKYFPRGLISRRGSIDIEAWNYLDTLIDFGGSSGVLSAGIIINQFDGTDCNDDLITTAEPKLDPAEIAILVPAAGDDIELDKNFTVSGTSNCANVKIEASADGTTWVTLAASVAVSAGAFSKADCQLPSASFDINDEITIRVSDVDSISLPDTVAVNTIATITINEITDVTAGVAKTITGTTNGTAVKIYSKLHSAGSWDFKGNATVTGTDWTYDLTIDDAGTYDVLAVDGTDADGYAQQDSIEVEAGGYIPDGSELFIWQTGTLKKVPLGTDYDLAGIDSGDITTTKSFSSAGYDMAGGFNFTPNRKKIIAFYPAGKSLKEITLGTAGDISTASTTATATFDMSSQLGTAGDDTMQISPDGQYLFIWQTSVEKLHRWTMSTKWDITTCGSYTSWTRTGYRATSLSPDGTKLYSLNGSNNRLYQYTLAAGKEWTADTTDATSNGYVIWTGFYFSGRILFSSDKRKAFFLLSASGAPNILKYLSLSADYSLMGKVVGDLSTVDSSLNNTAFNFGV